MAGAPDGRGPAERVEPRGRPRPLPGEPPGSAESSGFSPGGRTSQAPSELAGAGTAASEIEAEERGRAGDRGEPAAPRPDAAGRWGPQDGSREERGCAAVVSGSYPRRPGGGRRGPGPSGRHEEAKNADHERGVGTWGRAPPRLGSAGADPACEPRDASEPPGPRKRRKGALKSSQGLGSPGSFLEDRLEEQRSELNLTGIMVQSVMATGLRPRPLKGFRVTLVDAPGREELRVLSRRPATPTSAPWGSRKPAALPAPGGSWGFQRSCVPGAGPRAIGCAESGAGPRRAGRAGADNEPP
ncbi:hypothetical protein R6Z07F_017418 [Ovis aries]